jgi:type IX secretion system PorP/SprF family membrane protein
MYFGEQNDYRLNFNLSTQSMGPFRNAVTTEAFGFDKRINRFGIGGIILANQIGSGRFNIVNFLLSGSYRISIDNTYRHHLVTGMQLGFLNHSFNMNDLTFENQYTQTSGNFDPMMAHGENISSSSITGFDASMGGYYWYYDPRKLFCPFIGLSVYHATMPQISFYNKDERIQPKIMIYSGTKINYSTKLIFIPKILVINQNNQQFASFGTFSNYQMDIVNPKTMIFGVLYNTNDVLSVHGGLKLRNNVFRLSYGFNTGLQDNFNLSQNAFELSIIISKKSNINPSFQ